jgi:hypothetical protein
MMVVLCVLLAAALVFVLVQWRKDVSARAALEDRLRPVNAVEDLVRQAEGALAAARANAAGEETKLAARKREIEAEIRALAGTKRDEQKAVATLRAELTALEVDIDAVMAGLYKPHFSFDTSANYRAAIEALYQKRKDLIRENRAWVFRQEWTVGNSAKKGERMQKQLAQLMLRAFNGETEAAVANVAWNNITKMEERIRKSFSVINDMSSVVDVDLTEDYLKLAIDELRLKFELEERKQAEREEQRRIKEQMRDEEKARKEVEKQQAALEAEERRAAQALEKARAEISTATGAKLSALEAQIREMEARLAEVQSKERALSMAQQTKAGHVYVVSNIGSFGEQVYKVGMTRRLEPLDRVRELGDASVPFDFDVHAMIHAPDAPALESALHRRFHHLRLNLVNFRKEFFRVDIQEVQRAVSELGHKVELTLLAEARQFRESEVMRKRGEISAYDPASEAAEVE